MNKIERMKVIFANQTPDYTPAGFWFHSPSQLDAKETAQAHIRLYRQLDNDIIKIMDDSFGRMITEGIRIEKAEDWRVISLPGRKSFQYR